MKPSLRLRILLTTFLCLAILRLVIFIYHFQKDSLQIDFAAYYTAGQVLNAGLSPYQSHTDISPNYWDGLQPNHESRFIYLPIVGIFFQLLAFFPYAAAKLIWMLIILITFCGSMWVIQRFFHFDKWIKIVIWCFALSSFPLLAELERGQIDTITMLMIIMALFTVLQENYGINIISGILLVFAIVIKFQYIFLLPFFLLRKTKFLLAGILIGSLLILICILAIPNQSRFMTEYIYNVLPRINNQFGVGSSNSFFPEDEIARLRIGVPEGMYSKDGRNYLMEEIPVSGFSSMIPYILMKVIGSSYSELSGKISIALYLLFLIPFGLCFLWRKRHTEWIAKRFITIVFIGCIITLLCAPSAWIMNAILLLPIIYLLVDPEEEFKENKYHWLNALAIMGAILIASPDLNNFPYLLPTLGEYVGYRVVIGEVLLLPFLILRIGC